MPDTSSCVAVRGDPQVAQVLLYIIALYKQPQNSQFGTPLVVKNVAAIAKPERVQRAIIILYNIQYPALCACESTMNTWLSRSIIPDYSLSVDYIQATYFISRATHFISRTTYVYTFRYTSHKL